MDMMSRIPAGTEKEQTYPIKEPASLSPWFFRGNNRKCRNGKIADRATNTRRTEVADKDCCRGDKTPL